MSVDYTNDHKFKELEADVKKKEETEETFNQLYWKNTPGSEIAGFATDRARERLRVYTKMMETYEHYGW